jgi:large subunit ribosomal protein L10
MITREIKENEIKLLAEKFQKAKATFLVDFKGMKVEQVTALRKKIFPLGAEMRVVRNTLAKRAAKDFPQISEAIDSSLKGTNALMFAYTDPSALAKILTGFAKDIEFLQIKTGVMDGQKMDQGKITFLSTLPTLDVLRAQFLALLNTPASQLVRTINEVPSSLARVLAAKKD